jgi:NADH:ubiquinone oxidoreductase subunit 5 (subunit L)/multisubunit Na+/H+ antiporter MnhA subunit
MVDYYHAFFFDWIYLLFMGFVFIISSLVILYRDDYISGDLNSVRFIMLVLMFMSTGYQQPVGINA